MDFDIKSVVLSLETLEKSKLEDFKDRCGRQVLSWALTDPAKLKTHRDQVKLCEQLVNRFGTDFLKDIEKKSG